ncbi:polysaccharide deacetylase family protein [Pedobacter gandavensis]|uniref:Polysaccharide deacetylase family protein n=1 Tax=Pedobacter gandavensis TaxID=2679963 RepID=A0ABR6EZM4_9SPHI|nr:polysaccharide deacetylase family protein [Pedobacter gandavensis]MBB2150712.1 polysaccharide deacetylase family protein [Pedobacter gandavensis]
MKHTFLPILAAAVIFTAGCQSKSQTTGATDHPKDSLTTTTSEGTSATEQSPAPTTDISKIKVADAKTILARKQVPILCYHQVRDWREKDSKAAKDYIIPIATFKDHMKMLADSGYHTILPDQLYDYLNNGTALPSKPIMLTFDDTDLDQFTIAAPEMKKYGFKGVFFVMTVSLGRPNYMSRDQVKQLSDMGHVIGSHTWDHHNVKKYQGQDWVTQIEKPTKTLEEITGKKIQHFAYPFGLWNPEAIPELKKRGMKSAFILATKRDENDPLYTIRRIIASGYWTSKTLNNSIKNSF